MRRRTKARECALKVLYQIDITKGDFKEALRDYWSNHKQIKLIKDFTSKLVTGTIQNKPEIDKLITRYAANWTILRMATIDRNIIRMAVFELLYTPEVPPKVCINEAVDLAKKFGDMDSGKFVNGVLDRINKEQLRTEQQQGASRGKEG